MYDDCPLVSVIIPAYNAEKFIKTTLESVLNQTYSHIEVIVVDDGSDDQTLKIVQSIAQQDQRIKLLSQPNLGVAKARNLAIKHCQGELVAPLDADDIWYPLNLEKQVQCLLNSDNSVGLVYAWSVDIDAENFLTGGFHASEYEGNVFLPLLSRNFVANSSAALIRRTCFEQLGGYNEKELKDGDFHGCEDWELYLRIATKYQFRVVPEFLIGYRQNLASMSRNYKAMEKFYNLLLEILPRKDLEIPPQIYAFSARNFYVYLAHQSYQCHNYNSSLCYLNKAFKADWFTMILSHDLYSLPWQIFIQKVKELISSRLNLNTYSQNAFTNKRKLITINNLYLLAKIQKKLPSKLYEKYYFRGILFKKL